ncbi:protein timeless homolog [Diachasma alloeum]|uniref:Timeout n=1 Tax=Diachasma alloeum TaxID=454923 RepID=A0A4E0RJS4_9HYME|nr:protein timeless homolog [Diachasma alloeum]XP_015111725.1 protein timeless homolog [Diachasma alloeum]XP_015111726.1 protein timeless homolog [Diachasma alloeum]THK33002.1 timeout [Diachasma alloeum]
MSDYISAELAATCAALGYSDGVVYRLDAGAQNVIKDLIKYLKRDDDSHTVRRYLGQSKLLQTDLTQIAIQHTKKTEFWDVLLRLIINLTSPALMLFNDILPTEKTSRNIYLQLVSHLQGYKKSLANEQFWGVVSNRLSTILRIESAERGEENELIIERILTLIRNVIQVPPDDNEKRADNDATVHDELLFALHSSGIVDLLLFIASNSSEQQYHMQILEIIALMLREQNATKLASVGLQRSAAEKEREEAQLLAIRRREITEKLEKVKKYSGSRHSRFGGTFVVKNMKAIGENQLICHKPFEKIEALEFARDKVKLKKPKNKVRIEEAPQERTSALTVRLFLKEFCVEFLNGAYNPVMRYAKSCIIGGGHSAAADASHYLWAMRFFMEFNRNYKFQVKLVSETISTEMFYFVQRQMEEYYESMTMDKQKIPYWSKRLHLALKAYQELLHTILAMDKMTDKGIRDSSRVIKSNVFYVPEYRETILSQLLCYDGLKMSRSYLVDLVTTAHIFLKMLEQFVTQSRSLVVAKLKRKPRKKNVKNSNKEPTKPAKSLEERWEDAGPELSAVMQDGIIPTVVPFDATLDTPIEEQKADAMKRIQKLLRRKEFEEAIGLLRSAREIWPENDFFGAPEMPVEEEFLALREIFHADLGVVEEAEEKQEEEEENVESFLNNENDENNDEFDEEEEAEAETQYEETNFNFDEFLKRFANVKVVKAMAVVLRHFEENSTEVNHYVVKMLHRIAWDCKMPAMIFQASIFRIFQRILDSKHGEHKELQKFAIFIIRRFAETAEKNRKAYMELLFWKNTREATEMLDGYDVEFVNKKVSSAVWTEVEEDELRTLFMEHQTNKYRQDLIDWILENIISDNRTRRGVIKKLKELHLIVNSQRIRSEVQKRLPKEWREEEIAQLTEMWERVKDDDDPVELIHDGLRIKRPKPKIKEKLLELGLAQDRKELRKKRQKKINREPKASWEHQSSSEQSDNDDSDLEIIDEGSKSGGNSKSKKNKQKKKRDKKKTKPTVVYTDAQLTGLLKDVINKNMTQALEWLVESLEDVLEDRDEESSDGIALVPLNDYSSAAMDSPSFQRFLRAIGVEPPADEQEAYWRIPASMMSATIRKRCELIKNGLGGTFVNEDILPNIDSNSDGEADEEGGGALDLEEIKKMFTEDESKSKGQRSQVIDSDSSSDEDISPLKMKNKSSGSQSIAESNPSIFTNNKSKKSKLNRSRVKSMDDSSDSDAEVEIAGGNVTDDAKRVRSDNSDPEDTPTLKKRRVIDSDEEDDVVITSEQREAKQGRKIISDDED